jgi:hypothetical protein
MPNLNSGRNGPFKNVGFPPDVTYRAPLPPHWGYIYAARGATSCRDLETANFLGFYAKDAIAPWISEERVTELAHTTGEGWNDECLEVAKSQRPHRSEQLF